MNTVPTQTDRRTVPVTVLIIGDWQTHCGVCGHRADPDEKQHTTVLRGFSATAPALGCGAVWTHVARAIDSKGSLRGVQEMRPDLVCLDEPIDPRGVTR